MNLQAEAKSWVNSNLPTSSERFDKVVEGLTNHLSEVVCNSLDDLAYDVRRASGPDHACSMIQDLQEEIKANASAKPIE